MSHFINIIFLILLSASINIILSLKFATQKISLTLNNNLNNTTQKGNIPVIKTSEGLYKITLYLGEPNQKFSLILDTGSSFMWVTDPLCINCHAEHKFSFEISSTFALGQDRISLNYNSGVIHGIICQDNLYIPKSENQTLFSNFNFVLIDGTDTVIESDGIFGLSKGVVLDENYKYSIISQLYHNKNIKNDVIIFDIPKNDFYIGEIPNSLLGVYNFTIKTQTRDQYWSAEGISVKLNVRGVDKNFMNNHKLIFDSGVNRIILPTSYITPFFSIIQSNSIFKYTCFTTGDDEICQIKTDTPLNSNDYSFLDNYKIKFYINEENSITLSFKDLLENTRTSFKIYFSNNKENNIILGTPFFEKYTIMFNKDNITIFDYAKNLEKMKNEENKEFSFFGKILIIGIIVVIVLLVIFLVYNNYMKKLAKIDSTQLEADFTVDGAYFKQS